MSEWKPITTLDDLLLQDEEEMTDGYWAGRSGAPEPGSLHSRAYWHGWRNGASDAGFREMDPDQIALRTAFVSRVIHSPMLQ